MFAPNILNLCLVLLNVLPIAIENFLIFPEISRSYLWQWVKHSVELDTGLVCSEQTFEKILDEEYNVVQEEIGQDSLAKESCPISS